MGTTYYVQSKRDKSGVGYFSSYAYEQDGIFYWRVATRDTRTMAKNGGYELRVIDTDACKDYGIVALPAYDEARQRKARQEYVDKITAEYRRTAPKRVSREERAEMRAAFGPGHTVVNVLTGRRTRT